MSEPVLVAVTILGTEYNISCIPEEKNALLQSASLLNERLTEIREEGNLTSEQASMMVALNFANDLIKSQAQLANISRTMSAKLSALSNKIDSL